ncbi:hypothetical protein J7M00_02870, partial [bacterium]|nr:hypothetical protein [bacterium]
EDFFGLGGAIWKTIDGGYIIAGATRSNDGDVSGWHEGYWGEDHPTGDFWVVKLSPEGSIYESKLPETVKIGITPNPFNSSVKITAPANAEITIYDVGGNVVYEIPSIPRSLFPQGERDDAAIGDGSDGQNPSPSGEGFRMRGQFIWKPDKSLASGIYLIRATTEDGQTITRRAILMK